jgi:hypothetical protein
VCACHHLTYENCEALAAKALRKTLDRVAFLFIGFCLGLGAAALLFGPY